MVVETNPPLYYSLLGAWTRLFGSGEAAVRALSSLAGLLSVAAATLLAKRYFGARAACLTAAWMLASPLQISFSEEARAGIFTQLAALLAIYGAVGFVPADDDGAARRRVAGRASSLALYGLACSAALYLHTTMFALPLLLSAAMMPLLWSRPSRWSSCAGWLTATLVSVLVWSWWISITLTQLRGSQASNIAWIATPGLRELLSVSMHLYGALSIGAMGLGFSLLGLAFTVATLVSRPRITSAWVLQTVVLGLPAFMWLLSQRTPVFMDRTVFWAQGPFFVLLAWSVSELRRPWLRSMAIVAASLLLASDALHWSRSWGKEPWRDALRYVAEHRTGSDAFLAVTPAFGGAVEYYAQRTLPVLALDDDRPGGRWGRDTFSGAIVRPSALQDRLHSFDRIWTLERASLSPAAILKPRAELLATWTFVRRNALPLKLALWRRGRGPGGEAAPAAVEEHRVQF